jgi:transposase
MVHGGGAAVDDGIRWAIIHAHKAGSTQKAIAAQLGLSIPTVSKYIKRYRTTGAVDVAPKSGRKKVMSVAAAQRAHELLTDGAMRSAKEAATMLHVEGFTGTPVHSTTLARAAKSYGKSISQPIHSVSGQPQKLLTKDTQVKRLAFARANSGKVWKRVMFTDRKKFLFQYPGQSFKASEWLRVGARRSAHKVNHPQALNIYAGVTVHGVTACMVVAGTSGVKSKFTNLKGETSKNITRDEYTTSVLPHLLAEGERLFDSNWTFQQDNDPTHKTAALIISSFNKHKGASIDLLQSWPPNSPDLNPIENLWGYIQARVQAKGCKTFDAFKSAVVHELKTVDKTYLRNLFKSMTKRIKKTLELGGGKTKY